VSDTEWFKKLVEDLARKKKLRLQLLKNGPTEFHAQIGMRRGKPLYEIRADLSKDYGSYRDTDVPYGEVEQVFKAGMEEQFSPFDDNTSARGTPLDLRAWLRRQLR
jgi:hypothetical protein